MFDWFILLMAFKFQGEGEDGSTQEKRGWPPMHPRIEWGEHGSENFGEGESFL